MGAGTGFAAVGCIASAVAASRPAANSVLEFMMVWGLQQLMGRAQKFIKGLDRHGKGEGEGEGRWRHSGYHILLLQESVEACDRA